MNRREALGFIGLTLVAPAARGQRAAVPIEIWRSPDCGCCGGWVRHLERNGFAARVNMVSDTSAARKAAGVPARLASCHTAQVGGYAIEGHVPAADIRRLLVERPSARGLAVPGMPGRAPGMDDPRAPPYDVLLIAIDETTTVYSHHG